MQEDACVCDRGFRLDIAGSCVACAIGFYKSPVANTATCTACPTGYTTFATGAVSSDACFPLLGAQTAVPEVNDSNESNETIAIANVTEPDPVAAITSTQQMEVPAVTFNVSIGNFDTQDLELQAQLIVPGAPTGIHLGLPFSGGLWKRCLRWHVDLRPSSRVRWQLLPG